MAKKIISITTGRRKFFQIAEEVQKPKTFYLLTINGEPQVVVMSYKEFEARGEYATLDEVIGDEPGFGSIVARDKSNEYKTYERRKRIAKKNKSRG